MATPAPLRWHCRLNKSNLLQYDYDLYVFGPLAAGACCAAGAAGEALAACDPPPFSWQDPGSRPADAQLGSATNINPAKGEHLSPQLFSHWAPASSSHVQSSKGALGGH